MTDRSFHDSTTVPFITALKNGGTKEEAIFALERMWEDHTRALNKISGLRADIEGLRKSIQDYLDGDYPNPRKHRYDESDDKCPHCRYWYEDCGACIEEHFILELKS